jgi:hypothetical protein
MTGAVVFFVILVFLLGTPWPLALLLAWVGYLIFKEPGRGDRP